jgi:hypothetical protein
MNRIIKITLLLIYVFFTQVYPVVHWHAQEHDNDVELCLSVHPPQVLFANFDHNNHHDQPDADEHEDNHFECDWEYTFQSKTIDSAISFKALYDSETQDFEPQPLNRVPRHFPLKFTSQYLSLTAPNRAPPFTL